MGSITFTDEKSTFRRGGVSLRLCFALFGGQGHGASVGTGDVVAKAGFKWGFEPGEELVDAILAELKQVPELAPDHDDPAGMPFGARNRWMTATRKGQTTLGWEEFWEADLGRFADLFARSELLVQLGATPTSLGAAFGRMKNAQRTTTDRQRVRDSILRAMFPGGMGDMAPDDILAIDETTKARQRAAGKAEALQSAGYASGGGFSFRQLAANATAAALPAAALPAAAAPAPAAKDPKERIATLLSVKEHISEEMFQSKMAEILEAI